jgi:hypothetical protein
MQLQPADIEREAVEVARKNLGADHVLRAIAAPWVDLDGDDAWRVTIVIQPHAADAIDGAAVLDNLVELHDRLQERGDDRLPFIEFATEQELRESDAPEP